MKYLLFISLYVVLSFANAQDYEVCFNGASTVAAYNDPDKSSTHSVPSGSSWGGVTVSKNCLTIKAGSSSSNTPNKWAWTKASKFGYVKSLNTNGNIKDKYDENDKYNFAVLFPKLIFWSHRMKIECDNIIIAKNNNNDGEFVIWTESQSNLTCKYSLGIGVEKSSPVLMVVHDSSFGSPLGRFSLGQNTDVYDNLVDIIDNSDFDGSLANLKFNITEEEHSLEVPYYGVYTNEDSSEIHIISGRYNTSEISESLKQSMKNAGIDWDEGNMYGAYMGGKGTPNELHFFIRGDISFDASDMWSPMHYKCEGIYLAQGHKGSKDNWWMVSNNNKKNHTVTCTDSNENKVNVAFKAIDDVSNKFSFFYGKDKLK